MSDTIFTDDQSGAAPVAPQSNPVVLPPEVVELVGDGKKYKTVDDALKALPHAQKHISTIEQENATLKAELEKRKTTEEILESIKSGITPPVTTAPSSIDADTVAQTVNTVLSQREAAQKQQTNTQTVIEKFSEKFADKAEEQYLNIAKESGLTVQELNKLAATAPSVVLKLAGLDGAKPVVNVGKPNSTVNTESLSQHNNPNPPSAKVPLIGATTKQVTDAWRAAGEIVKNRT